MYLKFRLDGSNEWTIAARRFEFGTEIGHRSTYTLCLEYCLWVNKYGRDGGKLRGMCDNLTHTFVKISYVLYN